MDFEFMNSMNKPCLGLKCRSKCEIRIKDSDNCCKTSIFPSDVEIKKLIRFFPLWLSSRYL